ncbi:MAG: hypothetical protein IIZ80_07170 [Erysipelotrichaceae bacterium]|nr:hypothetical protein [Erysipelotrichaceae bacterium]
MKYEKMTDCFASLSDKVAYAIDNSDLKKIFEVLDGIEGPTLVCGVGGSAVVGTYLAKILREKKHIIATFIYPRDLYYMNVSGYENIVSVSYSGNNIGVDAIKGRKLNKYLLTGNPKKGFKNIVYKMLPEASFVSIGATIVPLSILTLYYKNDPELVKEIVSLETGLTSTDDHFEVMSGYETITAATLIESALVESGMATCLVHEKYNYCHGRVNITKVLDSDLIFFKMNNELDEALYSTLYKYYDNIICIERRYKDDIINDFCDCVIGLKLIRNIALIKGFDISDMKEVPDNDVLYLFNGKMK